VYDDDKQASWQATLENLWWVIYRMAEKYVDAEEYNSYKHGLRMMSAKSTLAVSSNPSDFSRAFVTTSAHSITHLKFDNVDAGTAVSIETKAFNPEESRAHVQLMAEILGNMKRVRLADLSGEARVEMTLFPDLDREGLQKLAVLSNWTLSV
jgi:hypothetical protein